MLTLDTAMGPNLEHEENLTNRFTVDCERGVVGLEDWYPTEQHPGRRQTGYGSAVASLLGPPAPTPAQANE